MAFNPLLHNYLHYYVPPRGSSAGSYFTNTSGGGGTPTADGDLIGTIATGVSGATFNASSDAVRPTLTTLSSGDRAIAGASGLVMRHNSTSYGNPFHVNQRVWFIAVFQMDAAFGQATRVILDNTNNANATAASAQGLLIGTQAVAINGTGGGVPAASNNTLFRLGLKNNTTTPMLNLLTEELLSEASPSRRVVIGYAAPGDLCKLQVDNGRASYGRIVGAAGSGNAVFGMFLLNRASLGAHFPGKLVALGVYTDYPGDAALAEWLAEYPKGNLVGSPELRIGDFHLNLSQSQQFIPYCNWFNKQRISPASSTGSEDGFGAVANDGVSAGGGWIGGPHGSETLVGTPTIKVDGVPVTWAVGSTYRAESRLEFQRRTVMGTSFNLTETHTLTANSHRQNVLMERLNDGRTIGNMYPIRHPRTLESQDYAGFYIDGSISQQGSLSTTTNSVTAGLMPTGTIAIAQWDPSTSLMALTVLMKGYDLSHTMIIVDDTYNRRVYNRVTGNPAAGTILEMETLDKFFVTTASQWQNLAASELRKILSGEAVRNRVPATSRERQCRTLLGRTA